MCIISEGISGHAQSPTSDTLAMAAALLAEDGWTDAQIARYLGISRRTLARWKTRPDMVLAFDACRLLQMRAFGRRHGGQYWRAEYGPKSPAFD
jgi:DNA-binding XRE family transcriptional regulator